MGVERVAIRRVTHPLVGAPAAGGLIAASLPPAGWWPLGIAGFALFAWLLHDASWRRRIGVGFLAGVGLFVPSLWWISEFSLPGFVLLIALEAAFWAAAALAAPGGLALPATIAVAEWCRGRYPYGGLPMGGPELGQAAGPLADVARLGGPMVVVAVTALCGAALALAARSRPLGATVAGCIAVVLVVLGIVGPDGESKRFALRVAAVQGGGQRGFRGIDSDPAQVFEAHLSASRSIKPPVELVLWPEDVVDVGETIRNTPEDREIRALAQRLRATVVAGVVEDAGPKHFVNAAVFWEPDGVLRADRYVKVRRVPFGEWVPLRNLVDRVADLSPIPRDAVVGKGPGVLRTSIDNLGVLISYEVFYSDRARAATNYDTGAILVPTNAASFRGGQVPAQEIAASRLRAIETGRWILQAAPTGYSALVRHDGRVLKRTSLGARSVLQGGMSLRAGKTIYTRIGDGPVLALLTAFAALVYLRRTQATRQAVLDPSVK